MRKARNGILWIGGLALVLAMSVPLKTAHAYITASQSEIDAANTHIGQLEGLVAAPSKTVSSLNANTGELQTTVTTSSIPQFTVAAIGSGNAVGSLNSDGSGSANLIGTDEGIEVDVVDDLNATITTAFNGELGGQFLIDGNTYKYDGAYPYQHMTVDLGAGKKMLVKGGDTNVGFRLGKVGGQQFIITWDDTGHLSYAQVQ